MNTQNLHDQFTSFLPRIEAHARYHFRHLNKTPEKLEESVAETVALAWQSFSRLVTRGKDPSGFISAIATYAAKWVRSGRGLCGIEPAQDVMSSLCQQRHSFKVGHLHQNCELSSDPVATALTRNTRTSPPDGAAFRIDYPNWRRTHTRRNRKLITEMAKGERTQILARRYRMTPGRVSQLRLEFCNDWKKYHGEACVA